MDECAGKGQQEQPAGLFDLTLLSMQHAYLWANWKSWELLCA